MTFLKCTLPPFEKFILKYFCEILVWLHFCFMCLLVYKWVPREGLIWTFFISLELSWKRPYCIIWYWLQGKCSPHPDLITSHISIMFTSNERNEWSETKSKIWLYKNTAPQYLYSLYIFELICSRVLRVFHSVVNCSPQKNNTISSLNDCTIIGTSSQINKYGE